MFLWTFYRRLYSKSSNHLQQTYYFFIWDQKLAVANLCRKNVSPRFINVIMLNFS